jgi:hypothetical protein
VIDEERANALLHPFEVGGVLRQVEDRVAEPMLDRIARRERELDRAFVFVDDNVLLRDKARLQRAFRTLQVECRSSCRVELPGVYIPDDLCRRCHLPIASENLELCKLGN